MIRKYFFKAAFVLLSSIYTSTGLQAQTIFQQEELNTPIQNGDAAAQKLITKEVYEYKIPTENCIVLKNGFRKHNFVNAKDWLKIKDSVVVSKVQIVFSKYPFRNGEYNEIYPLLFNRIKATIALDPALNDQNITWERVWQTHCENNAQVDELFHGIVIHYDVPEKEKIPEIKKDTTRIPAINEMPNGTHQQQSTVENPQENQEMSPVLEYMLNHPSTPESLRQKTSTLSVEEAEQLVLNHFREEGKSQSDGPITDPTIQLNYMYELEVFARQFPTSDTVVGSVLNRHPEWNNKIIINDWTGSMYSYGSQVLLWHLMHLETSGISTVTLFNDGGRKSTKQKKIGKTGGIYTAEANSPDELLELFNSVMQKGGGGDGPENDVEAILKATKNAPNAEIILIADNSACVRDIVLANQIDRPLRIILCGYDPKEGVNPDYVYLASITKGGIYTMEEDLEQLDAKIDDRGAINSFSDDRFKISSSQCIEIGREYNLKKARRNKKEVRVLKASNLQLRSVPNYMYKMTNLHTLDLSNNRLSQVDEKIENLERLSELNLSNNSLSSLPNTMEKNKFMEFLSLEKNKYVLLPKVVYEMKFLREIRASNNQLTALEKFESRSLILVDVSHNNLAKVNDLSGQNELVFLNSSHNQLTKFPEALPLKHLEELDLSFNQISQLPDDLTPYMNLKKINLEGNPIPTGERIRIRQALFHVDLTF